MARQDTVAAPWHLWAVGIGTLIWNAIGVYDYVMIQSGDPAYPAQAGIGPEEFAWLAAVPPWAAICWAFGVMGGLFCSTLLLVRSRRAVSAGALSLIGMVVMGIYQLTSERPAAMTGLVAEIFPALMVAVAGALLYYAIWIRMAGLLR